MYYAIGCFPDHARAHAAARSLCAHRPRSAAVRLYAHTSRVPDFGGLLEHQGENIVAHPFPDSDNPDWLADLLLPFEEAIRRGGTVVVLPEDEEGLATADVQQMQALGAGWPEDPAVDQMDPKLAARLFPYRGNAFLDPTRGERYARVGSEHGVIE